MATGASCYAPSPTVRSATGCSEDDGYSAQWSTLQRRQRRYEERRSQTFLEFQEKVALQRKKKRRGHQEEEEEEALFYRSGYSGERIFRFLNPANPTKSRRRVERLYWVASMSLVTGFFLSSFGTLLFMMGMICAIYFDEKARGAALLIASALLCIPGYYSLYVLWMYVRCKGGYSFTQLPGN